MVKRHQAARRKWKRDAEGCILQLIDRASGWGRRITLGKKGKDKDDHDDDHVDDDDDDNDDDDDDDDGGGCSGIGGGDYDDDDHDNDDDKNHAKSICFNLLIF
ncbi:hypothetical protein ElyMa_005188300 [Elysia marginata]|uniref:Uncharacterized protein n=1 Tax=Elysia marginata TaxID=1093978 RepID=A0AAV4JVP4_9GAST|nr:hypothetical protein ElyMa_005188300 [Elysia marginata]